MQNKRVVVDALFQQFPEIRYTAIYEAGDLYLQQRQQTADSSAAETDKYEELLVNPAVLLLARQRGNIDCGGLRHIVIAYGPFYQLIKEIRGGHISICLAIQSDLNTLPLRIFSFLAEQYPGLL
ncbi:hypothetical protein KTO58_11345 [Chitinophaga pendula]|uniref:hypothetical protein n=1 Tax=Chitinophaga TaxID=79328 RepID=UPI0012FE67D2|nr:MULTISPECIES: hypothetical protein [Chitinophaga]UCJ09761.1 hypothetical protein KTO58_11345 [Chitinophaga pendula]